jgi:uncharacterized protein (UPF0335 family)
MPRKRKSADAEPKPANHNQGPSQAKFLEHFAITALLAAKRSADSNLSNAYKQAERDGIDRKILKRAFLENDKTAADRERADQTLRQYMEWLGKPLGTQAAMDFGNDNKPAANGHAEADPETAAAVASHEATQTFHHGVTAGRAGAAAASNPHQPGSEQAQQWSTGWAAGQKEAVMALGGATHRAAPV